MAIKAIIFDLGGVVVDFSNAKHYVYLSELSGMSIKQVKEIIEKRQLDLLEKGRIDIRSFERNVARMLDVPVDKVRWFETFRKTAKMNPDVEELAEMLHKEYVTAFISNIDKTRYAYARMMLNLDTFDYRFASCFIGARKPHPKIFRFALRKMGMKPQETVFIDDLVENVKGAKKLGIKAVHFTSRRSLDTQLARLGV